MKYTIERSRSIRGDYIIRDQDYRVIKTFDLMSTAAREILDTFSPALALDIVTGGCVPIAEETVEKYI